MYEAPVIARARRIISCATFAEFSVQCMLKSEITMLLLITTEIHKSQWSLLRTILWSINSRIKGLMIRHLIPTSDEEVEEVINHDCMASRFTIY